MINVSGIESRRQGRVEDCNVSNSEEATTWARDKTEGKKDRIGQERGQKQNFVMEETIVEWLSRNHRLWLPSGMCRTSKDATKWAQPSLSFKFSPISVFRYLHRRRIQHLWVGILLRLFLALKQRPPLVGLEIEKLADHVARIFHVVRLCRY